VDNIVLWKRALIGYLPFVIVSSAQTFTSLLSFSGTNGANPTYVSLAQGLDGNIFGTTYKGGANQLGTVFQLTLQGTLIGQHSFSGVDGAAPEAGLVLAADGNFYGTTFFGGSNNAGTIFKISPATPLTTLYSFGGTGATDGSNPFSAVAQTAGGGFYGTTLYGGANDKGSIFKLTGNGTLTTLHSFNGTDGLYPSAALIQSANKNLYGTTMNGGANGYGTVFSMTGNGSLTTLYNFDFTDGAYPLAGLVQAPSHVFYGTTSAGGSTGYGTVFQVTSAGALSTLHTFSGSPDGAYPEATLILATDGNFYGTTYEGGAKNAGTIFLMTPSGTLTTLYSFSGPDGANPQGALLQATDGNLYGITNNGGSNSACSNCGTVFRWSTGLQPFVTALPSSGASGTAVKILGTNLTGATSVTFHGVAAKFTVVSASEITTAVPSGATTGTVRVVTPGATLLSDLPFRVM
jgi:uncharacterized repeat protein (TIGR03803 family)